MKKNVKRSKKILEAEIFSFETVSKKDVLNLIKELPGNKATVSNNNPVSELQYSLFLAIVKNLLIFMTVRSGTFPEILKVPLK